MAQPRICCIDKTQYTFCPHCGGTVKPEEAWKTTFCSENCRDLYNLCNSFAHNKIDAAKAKEALSKLDFSKVELFPDGMKNNIADILAYVEEPAPSPIKEEVVRPRNIKRANNVDKTTDEKIVNED